MCINFPKQPSRRTRMRLLLSLGLLCIGYGLPMYSSATTNIHAKRSVDFTQDTHFDFTGSKPMIRCIGWDKLTFQQNIDGQLTCIYKDRTQDHQRADTLLWHDGSESWAWKPLDGRPSISHRPGYTSDMIAYIAEKDPEATHIILSTGWDDVLCCLGKQRGTLSAQDLQILHGVMHSTLGANHTSMYQSLQEALLRSAIDPQEGEVLVYVLATPDAAWLYNHLLSKARGKVILAFHATC